MVETMLQTGLRGHASHEACELKCWAELWKRALQGHASHEACELKFDVDSWSIIERCHASHEACELKCQAVWHDVKRAASRLA